MEKDDLLVWVRKGFFVWTWLGLLAAYIGTSSAFSAQISFLVFQGVESPALRSSAPLIAFAFFLPSAIIIAGWLQFYSLSSGIARVVIEGDEQLVVAKKLVYYLRSSILYLVVGWAAFLTLSVLPVVLDRIPVSF